MYPRFTPDPLTPNTFLDDKPEDGRLVSMAEYEQPNDWGYYNTVIYPATNISVAALNGIWKNADGKEELGDVRLQYRYNQDGEKRFCFTFVMKYT